LDLTISDDHRHIAEAVRQMLTANTAEKAKFDGGTAPRADRLAVMQALLDFGLGSMELRDSHDDQLAAALLIREVGAAATAVPVVSAATAVAARVPGLLHSVYASALPPLLNHADLEIQMTAIDEKGRLYTVETTAERPGRSRPLATYTARVQLVVREDELDPLLWSFSVVMSAFLALGSISTTLELAVQHVTERVQFGQHLSAFQGIRNRLADIVILQNGLQELANYTLWTLTAQPDSCRVDALLLRYHQLSVGRQISLLVHQLHGAMGFCYEYPLLQHLLGSQYERQIPLNEPQCMAELVGRFREIKTHYEDIAPAWPLDRADRVPDLGPASQRDDQFARAERRLV
jgi:alkylation response protein AidB-like acyl-CoA dehydrogenase